MTTISDAFPSKYLQADNLKGKDHLLIISNFTMEEFTDKGQTVKKPVLYFQGKTKGMVCNKTNARAIGGIHGPEFEGWIGKAITIGAVMVPFGPDMVNSIRVRPDMPTYNQPPPPAEFDQRPVAEQAGYGAPEAPESMGGGIDDGADIPF